MSIPNDASRLARDLGNTLGFDYDGDPGEVAKKGLIRTRIAVPRVPADAAANSTLAANVLYSVTMPRAGRVVGFGAVAAANVAASASDYKTISLVDFTTGVDKASATTQPTANGGVGALTVGVVKALTPNVASATSDRFSANDTLAVKYAVGGSGVAMPITSFFVDVEWEGV